jgi:dipeptidyl aminopeptidase/acylaminoacyl peptidase
MSLPAGARLGPYEILTAIGAGGMGEVYNARDTRLDRIVAVKVLSERLAADSQFRARFELEARAISQLAHPNICTLSPDGRRLAITVAGDIWIHDLLGRPPIKLTFEGSAFSPVWSVDGQRLVYESADGSLLSVPADGSASAPKAASPPGHFHAAGWLPSGEVLAARLGMPTVTDIVRLMPGQSSTVHPVVQTDASEGGALSISPDGRWLGYVSDVTGRGEVWVRPYPGPAAPIRVSANGGIEPQWARNGRELYYIDDRETMMMAAVTPGADLSFKPPVALFRAEFLSSGSHRRTTSRQTAVSCSCVERRDRCRPISSSR